MRFQISNECARNLIRLFFKNVVRPIGHGDVCWIPTCSYFKNPRFPAAGATRTLKSQPDHIPIKHVSRRQEPLQQPLLIFKPAFKRSRIYQKSTLSLVVGQCWLSHAAACGTVLFKVLKQSLLLFLASKCLCLNNIYRLTIASWNRVLDRNKLLLHQHQTASDNHNTDGDSNKIGWHCYLSALKESVTVSEQQFAQL